MNKQGKIPGPGMDEAMSATLKMTMMMMTTATLYQDGTGIFLLCDVFPGILGKKICSLSPRQKIGQGHKKDISSQEDIYTFQLMVKNGNPNLKALLGKLWHPFQALFSAKGPDPSLCNILEMRSNEKMQQMETARNGSFIIVINACSQNQ